MATIKDPYTSEGCSGSRRGNTIQVWVKDTEVVGGLQSRAKDLAEAIHASGISESLKMKDNPTVKVGNDTQTRDGVLIRMTFPNVVHARAALTLLVCHDNKDVAERAAAI
jgi:hypothetical protein